MPGPFKLNVNSGPKPAPTHWSNQFTIRRRVTAKDDSWGDPAMAVPTDLLKMIGVKVGEDVIMYVTNDGAIMLRRPEIQVG